MQVLAGMACNRDATLLRWVLILPMAALLSNEIPAIGLYEINHVPDLHMPLSQIMDSTGDKRHGFVQSKTGPESELLERVFDLDSDLDIALEDFGQKFRKVPALLCGLSRGKGVGTLPHATAGPAWQPTSCPTSCRPHRHSASEFAC